jgi:hypothetical protein
MTPGEVYTIELSTNFDGSAAVTQHLTYTANRLPHYGSCVLSTSSGTANTTMFTASALMYEDPEGDLPLYYKFGYIRGGSRIELRKKDVLQYH